MITGNSRYDPQLQMFADPPREPALTCLCFYRWLAERGRLEHEPSGVPAGEYAARALAMSPIPAELGTLAPDSERARRGSDPSANTATIVRRIPDGR